MSVTKTIPTNKTKEKISLNYMSSTKTTTSTTPEFAFGKQNYILMLIGLAFIAIGFLLMIGGGSDDPNVFSEEIFNFRRLTLAPTIVLIGFVIEVFAIMKTPKE